MMKNHRSLRKQATMSESAERKSDDLKRLYIYIYIYSNDWKLNKVKIFEYI